MTCKCASACHDAEILSVLACICGSKFVSMKPCSRKGLFLNKRFCAKSKELGRFYEGSTLPMAFVRRKMGQMTRLTGAKNIRIDFLTAVAAGKNYFTLSLRLESSDSHTGKMILTTSR